MAFFMGPRPPTRGVDMFRTMHCASVGTELSNAAAAWTFDARQTPRDAENNVLDSSANQNCIALTGSERAGRDPPQRGQGVVFFCQGPLVVPFKNDGVLSGRLEVQGVCLRTELGFQDCRNEPVF